MYRFACSLKNVLFPIRANVGSTVQTKNVSFCKNTTPEFSYIVVRSPELDDMKGGTGWVSYQKKIGDKIKENEEIATVDTEYYVVTILSPCEGVLDEVYVPQGFKVKSHQGMFRVRQRVKNDDVSSETGVNSKRGQTSNSYDDGIALQGADDDQLPAPSVEYVHNMLPKTYHNYTEPGDIYKEKSQKLKDRYELD